MKQYRWLIMATFAVILVVLSHSGQTFARESYATRDSLEQLVKVTATGLGNILKDVPTREKRINIVAKYIQPVRFFPDSSGYFFVYDMNGTCVAHATQPELVGKPLINLQDPSGQYVIQDFIDAAKMGGGFVDYLWNNPKTGKVEDKLGYAMQIPNTQLFIGSGIYFSSLRN